ncbi:hypothetical protein J437_LFUL010406 [Ladona fulva]|uniref:Uncharacterized protein n=1 Tax=Ladona fulva TaxID=123851 RepID=A0A8K0K857_LADFU|nr:hypothetical protein J437_LFUL010406 [Ladona fulva]
MQHLKAPPQTVPCRHRQMYDGHILQTQSLCAMKLEVEFACMEMDPTVLVQPQSVSILSLETFAPIQQDCKLCRKTLPASAWLCCATRTPSADVMHPLHAKQSLRDISTFANVSLSPLLKNVHPISFNLALGGTFSDSSLCLLRSLPFGCYDPFHVHQPLLSLLLGINNKLLLPSPAKTEMLNDVEYFHRFLKGTIFWLF